MSHFYQHSLLITLNTIKIYFRHNYCRIWCIEVGISIECCLDKISERDAGKKLMPLSYIKSWSSWCKYKGTIIIIVFVEENRSIIKSGWYQLDWKLFWPRSFLIHSKKYWRNRIELFWCRKRSETKCWNCTAEVSQNHQKLY